MTIIIVDRQRPIEYPKGMAALLHPELERTGPDSYELEQLVTWMTEEQDDWPILEAGDAALVYDKLSHSFIEESIGILDGLAIQEAGVSPPAVRGIKAPFSVFLWRSAVRMTDGGRQVPYLYECRESRQLRIDWGWIGRSAQEQGYALLFPQS